ncbi:threonyl-trna synthetase [Methylobacterium fujisawaense]|uniref:threonyl-trna synthetase n=1 Tax=Methylobacterium fujisawaense TaxID=107400 RepID=UPI002F3228EE
MRRASFRVAAVAIIAMTRVASAAETKSMEAPFGLAWGPVVEVPRPVKVDREANLTALYYPQGMWPATGPGTAEVVLVVCRNEGLQQVVWVGLPLSGAELARARQAIHEEGVRRFGEPARGPLGDSEVWPGGRALLASREVADGRHELVMTAFGPGFAACSRSHREATGHPAGAHVADLVGTAGP